VECSSAVETIEKFPKNVKHLKVKYLAKMYFDCSYVGEMCFFVRARVLTIISPDGDKSVEGLNVFLFPHRTDEIEFNTWGS
jgi:hypothetical protein